MLLIPSTPNKDTPGRPVDIKCRSTVKPTGLFKLMRNLAKTDLQWRPTGHAQPGG